MNVAAIMLAAAISVGPAMPAPVTLTPDMPVKVGNIDVVCTGVGLDARENPAWRSYPLKIEVAGRDGQYLGDIHLSISQRGNRVVAVSCDGPWLLFGLPAGKYLVDAETEGKTVSSAILVPATGQSRIVLRFPELGGTTAPATTSASAPPVTQ